MPRDFPIACQYPTYHPEHYYDREWPIYRMAAVPDFQGGWTGEHERIEEFCPGYVVNPGFPEEPRRALMVWLDPQSGKQLVRMQVHAHVAVPEDVRKTLQEALKAHCTRPGMRTTGEAVSSDGR